MRVDYQTPTPARATASPCGPRRATAASASRGNWAAANATVSRTLDRYAALGEAGLIDVNRPLVYLVSQ
jgi:hypothetical protein